MSQEFFVIVANIAVAIVVFKTIRSLMSVHRAETAANRRMATAK
ncbi:hypothetical protein [Martelella alba]|nr:hypothetical protein [Martelella alba]